jgi:ketosteroid isomerase-like protein
MGKTPLLALLLLITLPSFAQDADETAIRQILADQTAAWNKGDLDNFMKGYWHSDSLLFVGQSGVTYGYTQTLDNYKKHYDTPDKMGQLFFTLLKLQRISTDYYFVVGKWLLKRKAGDIGGVYTLLFHRLDPSAPGQGGRWVIIADHSS